LNDAFAKAFPQQWDNGIHRRSFVSVTAKMPTVLLEMGVLSYKPEGVQLADPAHQAAMAKAIAQGITNYFVHLS
jgi:N-acetylmuramoyl-L-alanine amidase